MPKSVLIVDDIEPIRGMIASSLKEVGISTYLAENGHAAVWLYEQHRDEIGVVLLDVNMPGLDGPDTFMQLRKLSPSLPIAFMSGDSSPYSISDLLAMGPVELFTKPLFVKEVVEVLKRVLARFDT